MARWEGRESNSPISIFSKVPFDDDENNHKVTTADELAAAVGDDGVLGLYFSAQWCGSCHSFTPQLVKCYDNLTCAGKPFEVVFVSSDYFSSMVTPSGRQWLALNHDERDFNHDLNCILDV